MEAVPKKVAVIGFDCAEPHLIEKHIKEGHLPTFKKLFEGGVLALNCLAPFPTITPPNWATIVTGAFPGTHGITDFHLHTRGADLDSYFTRAAFSSDHSKAEFIWDALDKAGKKCIVTNYPGSWPNHMKNGIVVGGSGLSISEMRDGMPKLNSKQPLCSDQFVTTGHFPMSIKVKVTEARDWKNMAANAEEPLAASFDLVFPGATEKPAPTTWHILATQGKDGYDKLTLSPTKDFKEAFFTIGVNQWSDKVITKIKMTDGSQTEVFFRTKLIELSDDGEDIRLLITALGKTEGWSSPPEISRTIKSDKGIFGHGGGVLGLSLGWFELDTYSEILEMHDLFLGDTVVTLLTQNPWDFFCMHSHPADWTYHVVMTDMDPATCKSKEAYDKAWATHLRMYQSQDKMLARIVEAAGKDTLFILVSDHGAVPDGGPFNPLHALEQAGLLVQKDQQYEGAQKGLEIKDQRLPLMAKALAVPKIKDWSKSKAVGQRTCYVYVNLKGRDPEGIVEPKDYEKVQREIIDALVTYIDPLTGKRPVALALTNQDARLIGLTGPDVGDVVYAIYPEWGGQHGSMLPTATWGVGDLRALLAINGPLIRKGLRLERTCWLTDIVPTICYIMDWPLPAQVEGAVIYQAFEDPNFKAKSAAKGKK